MQAHVLASGSTGNATLLNFGDTNILVDAGISARRIKNSLAALGIHVEDIDGVLITHEHRDHVAGLPTLIKKYRLPVYARPAAWDAMYCRDLLPGECRFPLGKSLDIGSVKIEPFSVSHDAADPVGFCLYDGPVKCSIATDLGFATDTVKNALKESDVIVLESNHDIEMLRTGSYPWHLKRRIMSNRGHLSNMDAGWLLARLDKKASSKVLLAHLSQENNRPELAEATVSSILQDQGCHMGTELELKLTYPDQTASLISD